jgi:hypothetical protein
MTALRSDLIDEEHSMASGLFQLLSLLLFLLFASLIAYVTLNSVEVSSSRTMADVYPYARLIVANFGFAVVCGLLYGYRYFSNLSSKSEGFHDGKRGDVRYCASPVGFMDVFYFLHFSVAMNFILFPAPLLEGLSLEHFRDVILPLIAGVIVLTVPWFLHSANYPYPSSYVGWESFKCNLWSLAIFVVFKLFFGFIFGW